MIVLKKTGVRLAAAGLAAILLASGCESGQTEKGAAKPAQTVKPNGGTSEGESVAVVAAGQEGQGQAEPGGAASAGDGGGSSGSGVFSGNSGGTGNGVAEQVRWTVVPCVEGVQPQGSSAASLPSVFERKAPAQGEPLGGIKSIAIRRIVDMAGYGNRFGASYALTGDGTLYAWGERDWNSTSGEQPFPVRIGGVPKLQAVDGEFALDEAGQVWHLGAGQTPRPLKGLDGVRTIRQSGMEQLAALKKDGTVWSWQRTYVFEEGTGERWDETLTDYEMSGARDVFAGMQRMYVLKQGGNLAVVPLDRNSLQNNTKDVALPDSVKIVRAEGATDYSSLFVQGENGEWFRYDENSGTLTKLEGLSGALKVTGGEGFALALMKDGTVRGWGSKRHMILPEEITSGSFFDDASPAPVPEDETFRFDHTVVIAGLSDVIDIQAGSDHALALRKDGTVLSWGSNSNGQLGRILHRTSKLTEVGTLNDASLLSLNWDGMTVGRNGDVFRLDAEGRSVPWVIGQQVVKATYSSEGPMFLTKSGTLVQTLYRGAGCRIVKASSPIRDINEDAGRATLALLENGSIVRLVLNGQEVKTQLLELEGKPQSKPARLSGYPFPVVVTDDGAVYAASSLSDTETKLKRVSGLPQVKEWGSRAPAYFDYTGVIGYALADDGVVYEVTAKHAKGAQFDAASPFQFEVRPTQKETAALYGALTITRNGKLFEQFNRYAFEEESAAVQSIRSMRSTYNFYIEGPGTMAHAAVTSDGRVLWLGDMPFQRLSEPPAPVTFAP